MNRLNVGGLAIRPSQDSRLWRTWEVDSGYMINADAGSVIKNGPNITHANPNDTAVASLIVYETARTLTNAGVMEKRSTCRGNWKWIRNPNQGVFRIFIDNQTAANNFDIYIRAGGMNKAYHEDYIDSISFKSDIIWIQLGPDPTTGSAGTDALLNGLEVFKLSRNGNLAYVQTYSNVKVKKTSRSLMHWVGIGAGIASIAVLSAICMFIIWIRRKKREENDTKKNHPGWRPLFIHGFLANSIANAKGSTSNQGISL